MKNERPWFKAFTSLLLDDPRLGHLPAEQSLIYLQLYALCARDGERDAVKGVVRDFAWRLHIPTEKMRLALAALEESELIEVGEDRLRILDWNTQQPEISEAERKRKLRASKAKEVTHLRAVPRRSQDSPGLEGEGDVEGDVDKRTREQR